MSDRLHDTLATLGTDLDRAPLADSSAVRARGNQRTRRQAVGTSLAVVALVAGAIGVSGALTGNNDADGLPADKPTVSTTQTPAPDPTVEAQPEIDSSVLLTADEMPPVPNQKLTLGETLEDANTADAEERGVTVCQVAPNGGVTPDRALLRTFPSDLDAFGWEWVAQYATVAEASQASQALTNACAATRGDTDIESLLGLPTGSIGVRTSAFSADPGSEFNGEIGGIVRRGDVVLVLGLRAMAREGEIDLAAFDVAVVNAADRIAAR
jgi:hypothetical protein